MSRVNAEALDNLRDRLADGFIPSPGSDLEAMMAEISASLGCLPLVSSVVARKTGGRTHHIEVECSPAAIDAPRDAIMTAIERVWDDELRYDDFAAHAVELTDERGIIDFLTATRAERLYLSGMIVVRFAV